MLQAALYIHQILDRVCIVYLSMNFRSNRYVYRAASFYPTPAGGELVLLWSIFWCAFSASTLSNNLPHKLQRCCFGYFELEV